MEAKPLDIVLSHAEKMDVVKRTMKDKIKQLEEVERRMRELMREDAEMAYLSTFIGPEYINPEGKNNAGALQPLAQERELLIYLITQLEQHLAQLEGGGAPAAAPQAQAAPQQPQSDGGKNLWGT